MKSKTNHWTRALMTALLVLLASTGAQAIEESQVTLLNYIRSTGAQVFNTGYTHKANTRIELDCAVTKDNQRDWEALFGGRLGDFRSNAFVFFSRHRHNISTAKDAPCFNRSGEETDGTDFVYGERIKLVCEGQTAKWYRHSDLNTVVGSITAGGTADDGKTPMYLFDLNTASSEGGTQQDNSKSVMTLYGCKIYEGSTLMRDFVPAKYNNEVGLYDRVNKTFGGSITTTPFKYKYEYASESELTDGTELLKNGQCDGTFNNWTATGGINSRRTWAVKTFNGTTCWASSCDDCTLSQTVVLSEYGFSGADVDAGKVHCQASADIISTWCNEYRGGRVADVKVEMLDASDNVLETKTVLEDLSVFIEWTSFKTDIFTLQSGTRKLRYVARGRDPFSGSGWLDQYGPAYKNLSLMASTADQGGGNDPVVDVQADYERALATIVDGQSYRVYTMYNGQKYYVTANGKLSTAVTDAPLFEFKKVAPNTSTDGAGEYGYGFQLKNGSYYFSNADDENGGKLKAGYLNARTDEHRTTWEAQVFFLNAEGKYAIRSTNAKSGTTGWAKVGSAFWTVETGTNGPVAQYDYEMNYVWQLEVEENVQTTYERALATIVDGQKYRVYTMYNNQKYYVTADGKLSTAVADAPLFEFKKVTANASEREYQYGFQLKNGSYYFTNPKEQSEEYLTKGQLNTTNGNSRTTWEAQVFFLNTEGKYAIRSTNSKYSNDHTNWGWIGSAFWTVNTGPLAEYSWDMNYVWQIEESGGDSHTHELVKVDEVSPTCTESGSDAYWKCSICGKKFSDENGENETTPTEIPPLGHIWGDWVVISEATPETPGVKQRICERDHSHVEKEEIEFSPGNLPVPEGAIDIAQLTSSYTAQNGDVLAGMGNEDTHIYIADGATVTLHNVDISHISTNNGWPGIYCKGNATIVLEGSNKVKGGKYYQPGIFMPSDKTLTIQGDGSLDVRGNGGCGIGTGWQLVDCGNIIINSGHVTAVGGMHSAGIGSSFNRKCGNITINGGTVIAQGGSNAPGIGAGYAGKCGLVTINSGFSRVTATKGNDAPNSIGSGKSDGNGFSTCSGVTILNQEGMISESPYTILAINAENFPDEAFRKYLLEEDYGQDGVLTSAEIAQITELEVGFVMNVKPIVDGQELGSLTPVGETKLIESLQGIEFFTALEELFCDGNLVTTLDLSSNTALRKLSCNSNQLTTLDVTKNTALTELSCYENQLTTIDLTKNPELSSLNISENKLSTLDVSQNPKLVEILLSHNQIGEYGMDALVRSLNTMQESDGATLYVMADDDFEGNVMDSNQVEAANQKHWAVKYWNNDQLKWLDYAGSEPVVHYAVKIGKTEVTSANKDDVLGDGTVTYTPGENGAGTLTFTTKKLKIEDSYYLIQANKDLTINTDGELSLETETGQWGIYTNAGLTINGNIKITGPCTGLVASGGNLTVNGDVDVTNTADIGGNWLLYTTGDMNINGNVTVTTQSPGDYAKSIECSKSITIGGDLTINNAGYYGLYTSTGGLTVGGSVKGYAAEIGLGVYGGDLNISGDLDFYITKSDNAGCVYCSYNAYIGGNVKLKALVGGYQCIRAEKDITIGGNAEMSGANAGIYAIGNVIFVSGHWDISGENYSIIAKNLTIPDSYTIMVPEGGLFENSYVRDADGNYAKRVVIGNPVVTYPVWVGDTQVTDANKDNVLGDGTVTYEPGEGTGTLTFSSGTTTINGMYNAAKIYADGINLTIDAPKGLFIENNVYGIYMSGANSELTVNGDLTFKTSQNPIYNSSRININGNLTAAEGYTGINAKYIAVNGNVNMKLSTYCISASEIVLNGTKHELSASSPCLSGTNITVTGDLTATSNNTPAINAKGDVTLVSGTWTLDGGNTRAIEWGSNANLNIPSTYAIIEPENAQIQSASSGYNARKTIADAEGNEATHVVIGEAKPDVAYTVTITGGKAYAQEPDPYELQQPVTEFKAGATVYVVPNAVYGKYVTGWETSSDISITEKELIYHFKMPAENVTMTPLYSEQTPLTWDLSDGKQVRIGDNEDDLMALEGLLLPFWQKGQLLAHQYYDYFDLDLDGTNDITLYEDEDTEELVIQATDGTNLTGIYYTGNNISPFGPIKIKFSPEMLDEDSPEPTNLDKLTELGQEMSVILKRTLRAGGWNTFASPVTFSDFTNVFGEGVKVKQLKDATLTDGVLNLKFEDATTIEGFTPYLVKVAADVDLSQKTITGNLPYNKPVIVETAALKFIPTMGLPHYNYTDDPKSVLFIGAGSKLYYADKLPLDIKGFRAYFVLDDPAAVRSISMDFGDGATSLHEIRNEELEMRSADEWYSVDGRKLSGRPTAKGVYINNGKKTIVK